MLVWIRMEWETLIQFWGMSTSAVDIQVFSRKKRLTTLSKEEAGQHVGLLCVLFLCDISSHDLIQISHHIGHT